MSKFDKLKEQTQTAFGGFYVNNNDYVEPKQEESKKEEPKKEEPKQEIVEKKKSNRKYKMLSFRLPDEMIEMVDKYSYVSRLQKQEVVMKAFDKFFNTKESKEILSQYDELVK